MKNMKTKTKNRTPRRILAVFLSILMLMSSFVFASPVVSEAAERVVFDKSRYGNYNSSARSEKITYNLLGLTHCAGEMGDIYAESRLYYYVQGLSGARSTSVPDLNHPNRTSKYYNTTSSDCYLDWTSEDRNYSLGDYDVRDTHDKHVNQKGVYYMFKDSRSGVTNSNKKVGVTIINGGSGYDDELMKDTRQNIEKGTTVSIKGNMVHGIGMGNSTNIYGNYIKVPTLSTNPSSDSTSLTWRFTARREKGTWTFGSHQPISIEYSTTYITDIQMGPRIYYYSIDSTELYNLYKDLYVGYNEGYYVGSPTEKFAKAMHAAELVLQGKLDRQIVATEEDGGYGYCCICQELLDAIVADLKAVKITVKFASILTTRSDPVDAAAFNQISMPRDYTKGLDVSINVSDKYDASNVKLVVNDKYGVKLGEYTPTGNSGSRYNFKVPITGDIAEIVATNFKVNQYKVSVPANRTGLEITGGGDTTVTHGDNYTFTVAVKDGYTRSTPTVKINGVDAPFTFDEATGIYTYTMENIKENKNVTIDNLSLNEYSVSYNLGEGIDKTADSATSVIHGNDATVAITIGEAYTQSEPQPTVDNGTLTFKEKDGKTFYYTLSGVTDDVTVTAPGLSKNTYKVALPTGEGYTAKVPDGVDLNSIVYGTDLSFSIDLDEQYNRSKVVVKYNGTVIEPVGGIYTIKNVTHNIGIDETDPVITVDGVELNHYYITLPLESESGFTIEVGEGLNAKSVLSGTDFNFKLFIDPAYSDSIPTIKVSRDGGDNYTVLSAQNGNEYIINGVLSDCIVVVENVKKNTYTVKFLDDEGNVDETVTDVEYGSSVEYPGESEPTKANETISDKTVDGVRTVVEKKYTFIGWSQDTSNVTSNMEVSPIFEVSEVKTTYPKEGEGGDPTVVVTPKNANILFISDGIIVHKESVEKGTKFSGWDGTPVKTSKNPYETYTFKGWDLDKDGVVDIDAGESTAIDSVKDDVMFIAVFESSLPSQTVTFKSFDGSEVLQSTKVKRGEEAKYELPGSPVRRDNTNLYDFAGWSLEKDADETKIVEKVLVADSDITLYAAYKKTPIVYSYKYINDGETVQSGTFYNGDKYKFTEAEPTRASTVDKDFTFDGWDVRTSGYETIYTATYVSSVRRYESNIPGNGEGYTITENKTTDYGDTFTFTVTLEEGYEETKPNVTSGGEKIEPASKDGNSYTYEIKLDGATAEEVYSDLTVTVGATINNYDVNIVGDTGCEVVPTSINSNHGGNGSFTVTLKEGYTQTAPTVTVDGKLVLSAPEIGDGKYVYTISEIKSDSTITVTTKINEYRVIVYNWKNKAIFNENVKHGSTPDIKTPVKPADKNGAYEFIGYDTNNDGTADVMVIENVTAPVTAKALYKYNHRHDTDPDENPDIWELVKTDKATCERDGLKHYTCKHGDGQTTTKVIPARKHNMTDWHIDKAPTCTETGLKSRHCQNTVATDEYEACSCAENGVVIPATGHHDSDGDYKCDDCGADLGHCSSCICHKGNVLSKIIRKICTILSKTFHTKIKCCKCMKWYGDEISSIS